MVSPQQVDDLQELLKDLSGYVQIELVTSSME